jgi:poly-gamma-glutamate synthase PgsB/CapB
VRACRSRIPLVVGGWGTRGKSGVERLKAALFHALGYEVVCKTTGCEATILVGVPGRPLVEVPLYRPYDKATIWEQRDVLRFAGARRPHVLLWECMALNPRYVHLLQRGWMRDDIATITNAYPDHEDIQGPTGVDVARAIAGFTPRASRLITAEIEMLPVIRDEARRQGTDLVAIDPDEHELIPPELLARFPYQEHPRNVALVLELAEELGIDRDVALVEMADHVLPDVGGLRTYGPVDLDGRRIRFANGMSANERASALGNWRRCELHAHDAEGEPGRWIVGFVNNRADRPARTLGFAELIVEDLAAHRMYLCGTDVRGLARAIDRALAARLARLRVEEIEGCLAQRKVGAATVDSVLAELSAWSGVPLAEHPALAAVATRALAPGAPDDRPAPGAPRESLAAARRAVARAQPEITAALIGHGIDAARAALLARFAVDSWAARRAAAPFRAGVDASALDDARALLRDLMAAAVVVPDDPLAGGAEHMAAVAAACPPGVLVDAMGLQNIKGPGLAVVTWFIDGATAAPAAPPATVPRAARRAWGWIRGALDHIRSVGRRRNADRLFDDLARGRLASTTAARALAALLDEQRR